MITRTVLALSLAAAFTACDNADRAEQDTAGELAVDAAAPPMYLSSSDAHPGEALRLSVTGATPGATVRFFYSVNGVGAGPRVAGYGNMAFRILAPVTQFPAGAVVADATGAASYAFMLPPSTPVGFTVGVQAAVKLGNRSYQTYSHEVEVTGAQTCTDDLYEDDDAAGSATLLASGAEVAKHLCGFDDDWSAVWVNAGEQLTADAYFYHGEGDIDVSVFAPDGATLLDSSTGVADNEHVSFTATSTGWHYVLASLYADSGVMGGNDYALSVQATPPVAVYAAGTFTVRGTWLGDLDAGAETYQANAAQPDFWYEQMTSTTRQLVPEGGAAFAVYGTTEPGYAGCAATVLSTAPISGSDPNHGLLPVGTWVCYETADGHLGELQVVSYGAQPGNDLTLSFTTWDSASAFQVAGDGVYTIPGTWLFDFETGTLSGLSPDADVWWEQMDATNRQLVPQNGALLAPIGYNIPGPIDCGSAAFSNTPISGNDLTFGPLSPYAGVCVRTNQGYTAGFKVLSIDYGMNNGLVIGETWWN